MPIDVLLTRRRMTLVRRGLVVLTLALIGAAGCSTIKRLADRGWAADYDTAEQRFAATGQNMLIHYKHSRPEANKAMEASLRSKRVKPLLRDFVCCSLFASHEPDRRYVAQFGVDRAPALIVVRQDGTYHSGDGSLAPEQVVALLGEAESPGSPQQLNALILRQARYQWHGKLDDAQAEASRTGRPILLVFVRPGTRDWLTLSGQLDRFEVHTRCGDWVHCRIQTIWPFHNGQLERFGVEHLPAVVMIRRDGTFLTLQAPDSSDQIARMADACSSEPDPTSKAVSAAIVGLRPEEEAVSRAGPPSTASPDPVEENPGS